MQQSLNNYNRIEASQKEVIAFYGDMVSINPKDVDFHGSATEDSAVLSYVKEHQDNQYFTIMYSDESRSKLFTELNEKIVDINPHTQFIPINSIEEFSNYYDNGSKNVDRESHPVESVKMLAQQDALFYDVKDREPKIEESKPVELKREYIKGSTISSNEMIKDVQAQFDKDMELYGQEFLDKMGLKGYNPELISTESSIMQAKLQLRDELTQNYILPQAKATIINNIDKVIPGNQAKSVKDGIEFVYDLLGDTDRGHLKIEYDCKSLGDCHIKGVYREYEKSKEATTEKIVEQREESNVSKEGAVLEHNVSKPVHELESVNTQEEQENTMDSTQKSQEIVANMELPQYDNSMDDGMELA